MRFAIRALAALLVPAALLACGSEEPDAFSLRFAAVVDGAEVGCTDELDGFGPESEDRIGINDLRLYLSNIRFQDAEGSPVDVTLDTNELQYDSDAGQVALVDLTGNTEGTCGSASAAFSEGTARTHTAITGTTFVDDVASISFDVGVPQAVMKDTIATNTPEGAPSPLNEMYWNWNSGYRHFVFNFSIEDGTGAEGAGFLHLGSRDCAPEGDAKALEDRDSCTFVNTPAVTIADFDLAADTVAIDLRHVLDGLDFRSPIRDPETFEEIGEGPGVECHSSPMQDDCPTVFGGFGLDIATGEADAAANSAFARL